MQEVRKVIFRTWRFREFAAVRQVQRDLEVSRKDGKSQGQEPRTYLQASFPSSGRGWAGAPV